MKDNNFENLITEELKRITENLVFSPKLRASIKAETIEKRRSPLDYTRALLNRTITIPLIPLIATAAVVVTIIFLPVKTLKVVPTYGSIVMPSEYKTVNLGNATTIIIDINQKGVEFH